VDKDDYSNTGSVCTKRSYLAQTRPTFLSLAYLMPMFTHIPHERFTRAATFLRQVNFPERDY
jgi:hypothetical protein